MMQIKNNQKNNIVFVGNVAFDQITNLDGYNAFVIGGSAFNSAFCASLFQEVSIEINSVVGVDFPLKILTDAGINTQRLIRVDEPTNTFVIDEARESVYSLRDLLDFSPKPDGDAWHLHVSCRKGINNPKEFFLKIKHQSASLDIMYSSLEEKMPEILDCLALSNMLFLNNKEYEQISQKVALERFSELLIFITQGKNGIILKKGSQEMRFETLRMKESKSYCAIGAGDAFIGGFLGAYFSSHSFIESLSYGMAIAALSVKDFGVLHLSDRMTEIKDAYVNLSAMHKKQQNIMQEFLGEVNENIIFPKIIFVVGGAGAGKSTLSGEIKKAHSAYNIISDLQELRKLLNSKQKNSVQSGAIRLYPPYVLPLPLGGFDIVNPLVWDYVLDATARKIQSNSKYVFEFARGSDARHIATLGIREEELYKHCFEIILSGLLGISTNDMLIIHVFSSFESRLGRNDRRKQQNNHFVAPNVMREVYLRDVFNFTSTSESNRGYLECNNSRIMVFSVDNSQELSSMEIKKKFGKKLQEAFEYYAQQRKENEL